MHTEDTLLPLSALQHLLFCERQCALIHIERVWEENQFTAEGRVMHDRAHGGGKESRPGLKVARSLQLRSFELGVFGVADIVEFHPAEGGTWVPFPVEYKRGKPKEHEADKVQLCAQAVCLEEMFHVRVGFGALFYGQSHRRLDVVFNDELRALTRHAAERLHAMLGAGITPAAERAPKCDHCSLLPLCMPTALRLRRGVSAWNAQAFSSSLAAAALPDE